ncbi:MAG TPA: YafY family protein [Bryobacteraceae bacterium]|nr:YafY family protein [Bryobacteraceae bacterium]
MRADRLLSILMFMQSRERVTARELAARLEVSERTILRDMDALSGCGIPVVAERGKNGGWSLLEDYRVNLTRLTPAEVQSLFLAPPESLMADLGLSRASEAALTKLEATLPATARDNAELARRRIYIDARGWRDPAESISCLPLLLDALWRGRRVRFVYARDLGEAGERTGDPLGLVAKGSTWYLIATVERDIRTYRVSRIREAAVLDEPANYPGHFDLAAHWERSVSEFREKLPRYYATFLADHMILPWIRYRGWRLEEQTPEGDRVRMKLRFDIEEEAVQFALGFGDRIEVVAPPELKDKVIAAARAILSKCAGPELARDR